MSAVDFPIALRLEHRPVLMVGAGRVAEGRIRQLLEVGANVTVVSPWATDEVERFGAEHRITFHKRAFEPHDVEGQAIIFTATNVPAVNEEVVRLARARGTLVNAADVPELCDFHMPAIGRRGHITVAVSTAGLAPALSGHVRTRALDVVTNADARLARVIGWLRRLWPAGPARAEAIKRIIEQRPNDRASLRKAISSVMTVQKLRAPRVGLRAMPEEPRAVGTVYLVGAGPGAADLLTVRAADLLARADTICHDRLVHPDMLARARPGARLFYVGKEGGGEQTTQDEINALLISQARLGRTVVRLKNGDPFVFGRGGEEALALTAAKVPFEVVPGVTSGTSVPALFGIPVTHRGVSASVTFATARATAGDAELSHLAHADTLVLYMAGQRLRTTTEAIIAAAVHPRRRPR